MSTPLSCVDPARRSVADRVVAIDLRGRHRPHASGGPLALVCGLPILIRNLLVLESAGFRRVLLLINPADKAPFVETVDRHPRVRIGLSWVEDAGETLEPVARALENSAGEVLYWPGEVSCGGLTPEVATTPVPSTGAAVEAAGDNQSALMVFGRDALSANRRLGAQQAIAILAEQKRVVRLPSEPQTVVVDSQQDVARAEAQLLDSLRKDADGALARYDRRISLAISARLLRYPVTPNQATIVAGLIGLASGVIASRGGYGWLLAGALCYLLSNIIDGVDGEIARAKLLQSRLGEWLDTLCDDGTNMSMLVGTAVGSYRTWHSDASLMLGATCAVGLVLVAAIMYHHLLTIARSGDLNAVTWPWERVEAVAADTPVSTFLRRFKFLARRDTAAYLFVVTALANVVWLMLWLCALAITAVWTTWAAYKIFRPGLVRGG